MIGQLSRYSQIIPEEHLSGLESCLRNVRNFEWMVSGPHAEIETLQGDILEGLPAAFIDANGHVKCRELPVVVLNNSCDLEPGRVTCVAVAPLVDFGVFANQQQKQRGNEGVKFVDDVRRNHITQILYLPPLKGFPDGAVALLDCVCSVSSALYLKLNFRRASLSQSGSYFFLAKLVQHFARSESREISRANT